MMSVRIAQPIFGLGFLEVVSELMLAEIARKQKVFFFQAEDGIRDKLVTGVQTCALPILCFSIHKFFQERGFVYVNTPLITGSDAEGAGAMFRVTTLDLTKPVNDAADFFGRPTYLAVSGQLEAEIFALAFTNVYTFGPTFRAENSNT